MKNLLVLLIVSSLCSLGCGGATDKPTQTKAPAQADNRQAEAPKTDTQQKPEQKEEILYKGKPATFWVRQLKDRDVASRLEAVKALREIGSEDEQVVPSLLATMNDKEKTVQDEAREAFGSLSLEIRASALLKGLKSDDSHLRADATKCVGELGLPEGESITAEAIKEGFTRKEAIETFARLGAKLRPDVAIRHFTMPAKTTDNDLRMLPKVPFPFGLTLIYTKITDAGIKDITARQNVTSLNLDGDTGFNGSGP